MSYYLTEANLINPIEKIPLVVAIKAIEVSDSNTTKSNLI